MSTTGNLLTSPVGEIQFMALNNPVKKYIGDDAPLVYTVRLKFDGSTKEGKEWKKTISDLNENLLGTKHTGNKDEYTVRASTKFEVQVTDSNGNALEETPMFFKDSKGTAKMIVQPYTGNSMGGSINLVAVVIESIDVGETSSDGGGSRESRLEQLKEALKNATS